MDAGWNAYITGFTASTDFPTQSTFQPHNGGGVYDAFVTELFPSGNSLIYSTYLGGNGDDYGWGLVADANGSAYIAGSTYSTNFPTQYPYQMDQNYYDGFVTKLSHSGIAPLYSTYLGGNDFAFGIAVDSSGSTFVTGTTYSPDFPTQNPYQTDQGNHDAFVAKFGPEIGPPPIGAISGSVNDSTTGDPIEGALVRAFQDGIRTFYDTTDVLGVYLFSELQSVPHSLEVSKPSYITKFEYNIDVFSGETTDVDFALVQEVPPCQYIPGDANGDDHNNGLILHPVNVKLIGM